MRLIMSLLRGCKPWCPDFLPGFRPGMPFLALIPVLLQNTVYLVAYIYQLFPVVQKALPDLAHRQIIDYLPRKLTRNSWF